MVLSIESFPGIVNYAQCQRKSMTRSFIWVGYGFFHLEFIFYWQGIERNIHVYKQ